MRPECIGKALPLSLGNVDPVSVSGLCRSCPLPVDDLLASFKVQLPAHWDASLTHPKTASNWRALPPPLTSFSHGRASCPAFTNKPASQRMSTAIEPMGQPVPCARRVASFFSFHERGTSSIFLKPKRGWARSRTQSERCSKTPGQLAQVVKTHKICEGPLTLSLSLSLSLCT